MNIFLKVIMALFTVLLLSCSSSSEDSKFIFNNVSFLVTDENDRNLLDPENPNRIDIDEIKLFYIDDMATEPFKKTYRKGKTLKYR